MINLHLNLSDIKNITVESVAVNGAVSEIVIQNLLVKLNLGITVNLTELRMNYSGSGSFSIMMSNEGIISIS